MRAREREKTCVRERVYVGGWVGVCVCFWVCVFMCMCMCTRWYAYARKECVCAQMMGVVIHGSTLCVYVCLCVFSWVCARRRVVYVCTYVWFAVISSGPDPQT